MDFLELQSFVTVCDCQNITEAARRLFITQPALSRRIRDLEQELGITLFVRKSKGIEITEAGHRLYEDAVQLLQQKQSLTDKALRIQNRELGSLHIGVGHIFPRTPLLQAVSAMSRDYPQVSPVLESRFTLSPMLELLGRGELDLALCTREEYEIGQSLPHVLLQESHTVYLVGRTHPLWNRAWIHGSDLAGQVVVTSQASSQNSKVFLDLQIQRFCPEIRQVFSLETMDECLFLAASGRAVVLTDSLTCGELPLAADVVRCIQGDDLPDSPFSPVAVYRESSTYSPVFLEYLKAQFPHVGSPGKTSE